MNIVHTFMNIFCSFMNIFHKFIEFPLKACIGGILVRHATFFFGVKNISEYFLCVKGISKIISYFRA